MLSKSQSNGHEPNVREAAFGVCAWRRDAKTRRALEDAIFRAPAEATDDQLIGLLRMGSAYALDVCRASASCGLARRGHLLGIALAGGPSDWHVLAQQLVQCSLRGAAAEAIGMHGEPSAVPMLVDLLEQRASVSEIRWALQTITGVHLAEPTEWRAWWDSNEGKLPPGIRHRYGRPFSLLQCIDEIARTAEPSALRERALTELEIRSGRRFPVDLDAPWEFQEQALTEWRQWWSSSHAHFRAGTWTFGGGFGRT